MRIVYLNNITKNEFPSDHRFFLSVTEDEGLLGDEIFERFHNFRRFRFLIILENTGNDNDGRQDDTQIKVIFDGVIRVHAFDTVSQKAQNSSDPEKG